MQASQSLGANTVSLRSSNTQAEYAYMQEIPVKLPQEASKYCERVRACVCSR